MDPNLVMIVVSYLGADSDVEIRHISAIFGIDFETRFEKYKPTDRYYRPLEIYPLIIRNGHSKFGVTAKTGRHPTYGRPIDVEEYEQLKHVHELEVDSDFDFRILNHFPNLNRLAINIKNIIFLRSISEDVKFPSELKIVIMRTRTDYYYEDVFSAFSKIFGTRKFNTVSLEVIPVYLGYLVFPKLCRYVRANTFYIRVDKSVLGYRFQLWDTDICPEVKNLHIAVDESDTILKVVLGPLQLDSFSYLGIGTFSIHSECRIHSLTLFSNFIGAVDLAQISQPTIFRCRDYRFQLPRSVKVLYIDAATEFTEIPIGIKYCVRRGRYPCLIKRD